MSASGGISLDLTVVFCVVVAFWNSVSSDVPHLTGGRGSSAVERATPGEEVPGSIPAVAARSLQAGSVSIM